MATNTTVYYNSACPVCNAGISAQKNRMQACAIDWIDIHENPEAAQELGVNLESIREKLHVRNAAGYVSVGSKAMETIWALTPNQRWLARAASLPVISILNRITYDLFARLLYRWNRQLKHW